MRDAQRPPVILLDLGARGFDQLAVLNSRRTRRLASTAVEAAIDVLHEGIAQRQPALIYQQHLPYAAARRIRFQAPQAIRGAMVEAEPAVYAPRVVFILGLVGAMKTAGRTDDVPRGAFRRFCRGGHRQIPP